MLQELLVLNCEEDRRCLLEAGSVDAFFEKRVGNRRSLFLYSLFFTLHLFKLVVRVITVAAIHAQRAEGTGLGIDDQFKRGEQLALFLGRRDVDDALSVLCRHGHVFAGGDGLSVDDGQQHLMERSKLRILATVGRVLLASHRQGELRSVHDELVLTAISCDADIVGFTNGHVACGDDIGGHGSLVLGARYALCHAQ